MNPKLVLAPAAIVLFHPAGRTVTVPASDVRVAFHAWVTACPSVYLQVTVQPVTAVGPAVTTTSAWKPPDHWFVIL